MDVELNGYYETHTQEWYEDSDSKTGWEGMGWHEEEDFELVDYIDVDKFGNPTKALFKYTGAVMLGHKMSAYNVQARMLHQYIEIVEKNVGVTYKELMEKDPEFQKLSDAISLIEEMYGIKEWLKL